MALTLWQRLSQALAGAMRQRLTRAGLGFSVLVSVVGALAFLSGNNVLFLLLGCLLAALLVSGFISRLSLAGLELDFLFPDHVSARRRVPALLKLKNEKSWMPSFALHLEGLPDSVFSSKLYFASLAGGATAQEMVEVEFARRGQHRQNSFRLRSAFPFGLTERQVQVTLRREALVYPCLDPQPGFQQLTDADMFHRSTGGLKLRHMERGLLAWRRRGKHPRRRPGWRWRQQSHGICPAHAAHGHKPARRILAEPGERRGPDH